MSRRWQRACLAAFLISADTALALSYQSAAAWGLIALPLLALTLPTVALPPRLGSILTWVSRLLIVAAAVRGDLGLASGLGLSLLAGFFLLNETVFPTGRAFVPAVLGVLMAAGSNPLAAHYTSVSRVAIAALVVWLAFSPKGAARPRRLAALAVFVAIAAGLAHSLIVFLPWAQPRVEETAARYVNPNVEAGMAIGARLGDIEQLALSRRVVLRMWSDEPMNLRAGVFAHFDGRAWHASKPTRPGEFLIAGPLTQPPSWGDSVPGEWHLVRTVPRPTKLKFARFVASEHGAGVIPAPAGVGAVKISEEPVRFDNFRVVKAPPIPAGVYGIAYATGPAPAADDDSTVRACLETPASTDARVRELATTLGGDAGSPEEKIARTVTDLQSRCRYSLEPGKWRTADPVSEFLFDKKKGYCEYFASATVLLLRLQGVPARYVNGLSVRDANRRRDHYVVRASDAHAWAEALVPGVGWVAVDATPPGEYAQLHTDDVPGVFEDLFDRLAARWEELIARVRQGGWKEFGRMLREAARAALPVAAPLLLIAVLYRFVRRRRRSPTRPPRTVGSPAPVVAPELAACLDRLEVLWTRTGCPRPRHRAPLEHALALAPERVTPEVRALSIEIVHSFYRGVFAGEAVPPSEITRLSQAVDEVRIGR
jgi:transglutaminase-like putative cysteine protease